MLKPPNAHLNIFVSEVFLARVDNIINRYCTLFYIISLIQKNELENLK
jgi:hypothetical protein